MQYLHFYPDKLCEGRQFEEKHQISLWPNHSAQTTQSPTTEQPWYLSTKPHPDTFNWAPSTTFPLGESALVSLNKPPAPYLSTRRVFLGIFQSSPTQYLSNGLGCLCIFQLGTSQYLSTGRGQVPATLTNKIQDHQPTWEIWEPEETYQICLNCLRRWSGKRGLYSYQDSSSL